MRNYDRGYTLEPLWQVALSTHNLCFGAKLGIPLYKASVTILKWGSRGYAIHGYVFLIFSCLGEHFKTILKFYLFTKFIRDDLYLF